MNWAGGELYEFGVPLLQPNLVLCDFFLFSKVNEVFKQSQFATETVMKISWLRVLEVLKESAFQEWFESWKL